MKKLILILVALVGLASFKAYSDQIFMFDDGINVQCNSRIYRPNNSLGNVVTTYQNSKTCVRVSDIHAYSYAAKLLENYQKGVVYIVTLSEYQKCRGHSRIMAKKVINGSTYWRWENHFENWSEPEYITVICYNNKYWVYMEK